MPQAAPQSGIRGRPGCWPGGHRRPQVQFVSQILRSTEVVWTDTFKQMGRTYENPKLLLFTDSYPTACGQGQAAAGPFYCPNDRIVYLDMGFFDLMTQQLNAPGQFAHAYVIGHEVGHHVQNLLGILGKVDAVARAQQRGRRQCAERQDRAAGRLLRRRLGAAGAAGEAAGAWNRGISKRRSMPPARSATTRCRERPAAPWCRSPSPMAPARSGSPGSSAASIQVT